MEFPRSFLVMAGFIPAIHIFLCGDCKDVDARHKAGHVESEQRASVSDEAELRAFAFRQLRNRLAHDDVLEMPRLLVVRERGLTGEDFVKEELPRLGRVLVNLELLHAGLLLSLGQEFLQQTGNCAFFAGIDLPECRHDQVLGSAVVVHHVLLLRIANRLSVGDGADDGSKPCFYASISVE
jgi:hypothetical protein